MVASGHFSPFVVFILVFILPVFQCQFFSSFQLLACMSSASGDAAPGKTPRCKPNFRGSAIDSNSDYTVVTSHRKCKNVSRQPVITNFRCHYTHNQPKLITDISHALSLPDVTHMSNTIMSSVITSDNNVNGEVSSFDFKSPKIQFNINNSLSTQQVIIIDSNTNYYENSHKGPFVYIFQAANKAVINLKLNSLQLRKQTHRRVEGVIAIKPAGPLRVKLYFESVTTTNHFLNSPILTKLK